MKQHEALGLALGSPISANAKLILLTIIYRSDFSTWEAKPMSVSYIKTALGGSVSSRSIERAFTELTKANLIERRDLGRADRVKSIKINLFVLKRQQAAEPTEPAPQPEAMRQPDIPPMSERHTPYVTVTDNIISNNQISNLNDNQSSNQSEQTKSLNSARETWGSREAMKDNSSYWGTSSGRGLTPATQPRRQKTHQEKMAEARELMKRTYAK